MMKHVQILAILNIVWGSIGVIGALIVLLVFGGIMGILGVATTHDAGAGMAIPIVGLIGAAVILILFVTSIPSIIAGIGLLRLYPWARILGIVLSILHLFNIPFGTALGIYGMWVLLSDETLRIFTASEKPICI
jgi:hypothetical protein